MTAEFRTLCICLYQGPGGAVPGKHFCWETSHFPEETNGRYPPQPDAPLTTRSTLLWVAALRILKLIPTTTFGSQARVGGILLRFLPTYSLGFRKSRTLMQVLSAGRREENGAGCHQTRAAIQMLSWNQLHILNACHPHKVERLQGASG